MDNIKQLGKYVGNSNKKANFAISRVQPNIPTTERIRDIFDYAVPFSAHFYANSNQKVLLDLRFKNPPRNILGKTCCGDCYCVVEERFAGGDTEYPLLYVPATTNTIKVYIDQVQTSSFTLSGGTVTMTTTTTSAQEIKISYVYKYDDCDEGFDNPCITDNFNRTVASGFGTSTYGTVWTGNGSPRATVNGTQGVLRADQPAAQSSASQTFPISPALTSIDARITWYLNHNFGGSPVPNTPGAGEFIGFSLGSTYTEISANYIFIDKVTFSGSSVQTGLVIDETLPIHMRWTMTAAGQPFSVYVWQDGEEEPSSPTLTQTDTSTVSFNSFFIQILQYSDATSAGPLLAYFDNLQIEGRCS